MGFNCLKAGGSLLFTTKFPEFPGTCFTDLERMKGLVDLEPPSGFKHGTPGLGIQHLDTRSLCIYIYGCSYIFTEFVDN